MIVLLNGWIGWRTGLIPLERGLRRRLGRRVIRGNIGFGMCCIRRSAERAAEQIDELARAFPGQHIDVIGHSIGGLVAAYVLKRLDRGRHLRSLGRTSGVSGARYRVL